MYKILALVSIIMLSVGVGGCSNTAEGAGQDIEGMGRWMQDTF